MKKLVFSSLTLLILFCFSAELYSRTINISQKGAGENGKYNSVNESHSPNSSSLKCKGSGNSACDWRYPPPNPHGVTGSGETITACWKQSELEVLVSQSIVDEAGEDYSDGSPFPIELTGVVTLNEILRDAVGNPVYVYRTANWRATSIKDKEITISVEMLLNP